jgi:hypothetical protein
MKQLFIVLVLLTMLNTACKNKASNAPAAYKTQITDSNLGILVADTIIYQVDIVNRNPEDTWAESCLQRLDHKSLVDHLFTLIEQNKVNVYDHLTNEKLTLKQIENMEKEPGFNRDNISMIQFKEAWYLNPETAEMSKKVISMVLGIAQYTSMKEFKGNKALFRLEMK